MTCDEPLSNLDAKLRVQMRAEIKALHQRLKTTTIYVTHDQVEAMTMADRIVVMRSGVVEQVGTPLELYDNPSNLFVTQFIGSPAMNVIEGEVAENVFRITDGVQLLLPSEALQDGRKLHYGIRPEHIVLSDQGVAGTVHLVEPTGSSTEVVVTVGSQEISVLAHERLPVRPAQQSTSLTMFPRSASSTSANSACEFRRM